MLSGEHERAEALLRSLLRKTSLPPLDRIAASKIFTWLNRPSEAIRILGPVMSPQDLLAASPESLCVQFILAEKLGSFGARYLATDILNRLQLIASERSLELSRSLPRYHFVLGDFYLNQGDHDRALTHFERAVSFSLQDIVQTCFAEVGATDALEGMDRSDDAIVRISRLIEKLPEIPESVLAVALQARGEYHFRQDRLALARSDFERAFPLFKGQEQSRDFAYLCKWSGALHWHEGNTLEARKQLQSAFQILDSPQAQPWALLQVVYWLEQVEGGPLGSGHSIALRCHPVFCPYSLLVGSARRESRFPLHPWIRKRILETEHDVWIIRGCTIQGETYSSWARSHLDRRATQPEEILDLVSGVHFQRAGKSPMVLTELQSRLLIGTIGAGTLGINEWALCDFVYRQHFAQLTSGLDRLKDLVGQLRTKGFPIERANGSYRWKGETSRIMLPANLNYQGPLRLLSALNSNFRRPDIEAILGVSARTANRWISQWRNQGLLQYQEANPTIRRPKACE